MDNNGERARKVAEKNNPPIGPGPALDEDGDIPQEELDEQPATPELIERLGFNPDTEWPDEED